MGKIAFAMSKGHRYLLTRNESNDGYLLRLENEGVEIEIWDSLLNSLKEE